MPPPFASRPRLETPRLHLAPANASDAQALQSIWNEPDVRKNLWNGEEVTLDRARQAVEEANAGFREKGYGLWCVSLRHSGVLAGFCGLRGSGEGGAVELVSGLAPSRTGQGYATEAARAVLAHALGACGLAEVWGRVDETNARGAKLLERLGMTLRRTAPGRRNRLLEYAVAAADFRTA